MTFRSILSTLCLAVSLIATVSPATAQTRAQMWQFGVGDGFGPDGLSPHKTLVVGCHLEKKEMSLRQIWPNGVHDSASGILRLGIGDTFVAIMRTKDERSTGMKEERLHMKLLDLNERCMGTFLNIPKE